MVVIGVRGQLSLSPTSTVTHNKSYAISGHKKSFAGPGNVDAIPTNVEISLCTILVFVAIAHC